ncbi:globin-coupled sensor protein [Gluconacetobacter azotocaptans]|uniref:globin-coupled sensor protein n=1 Tax=Gluconacetobacter azotocaptans TaxID=142834 RepID=UPI0023DB1633|nr:globin-coupled sensor protein [Gluconacetobacter azotocaptans]
MLREFKLTRNNNDCLENNPRQHGGKLDDIKQRREFMDLTDDSLQTLRSMQALIDRELPIALESFYRQVRKTPETRKFFSSEMQMQHAKGAQSNHWRNISAANFGEEYSAQVREIGAVHARIGLEPRWYIGGYAVVLDHLIHAIVEELLPKRGLFSGGSTVSAKKLGDTIGSLCKAVLLDIDLALSVYYPDVTEKAVRATRDDAIEKEQNLVSRSFGSVISQIAEGDLTGRVHGNLPLFYIPLRDNLNTAVESLRATLEVVNATAQTIDTTATQINAAAQDLSHRTERQAFSVEETAASIEQITSTVTSTAARVAEAHSLVAECQTITEQFGVLVDGAAGSMAEIERSSNAISTITDVMDAIAVQTHLLALNTSVEAGRVGESGAGFKALAQEIRDLARRAGEASKDVRKLVSASQSQVAAGALVMEEINAGMQTIITRVTKISDHLKAIADAAQEQARALHNINGAVATIDQGTRQNAAMVEQTSAASADLAGKAVHLRDILETFQL